MKIVISKKAKKSIGIFIVMVTMIIVFINIMGVILNNKGIYVFNNLTLNNKYETRSRLLTNAVSYVGTCSPEKTANIWSQGLEDRSAAMQYVVLSNNLKKDYANQLDKEFPNWVTGVSSPWVESYNITKTEKVNDNKYKFHINFLTKTSTGPWGNYNAVLTIEPEDGYWRITELKTDDKLYPYTGFKTNL